MVSILRRCIGVGLALCAAQAVAQAPAVGSLPLDQMRQFAAVYAMLKETYAEPVANEALVIAAIRGMLREVDPEGGEYYTADDLREYTAATTSGPSSIGVQLVFRAQTPLIGAVTPGGAADRAGLKSGDLVEAVDKQATFGLRSHKVHQLLRGADGSSVVLDVRSPGASATRRVELVRQAPGLPEMTLSRTAAGTAVFRLPSFQERSLAQVAAELGREWSRQPFDSLVLDLRGNPGGLLDVAIGVAAIFLPPDALVLKTVGRLPEANVSFKARPEYYNRFGAADPLAALPTALREVPLAVLVDEGTSAGAEIVAAALKDHRRASVVGRRTFGRGSIQTLQRLPDGAAVRITTAVWESPSGARFNGQGVQPDVALERDTPAREADAAADEARKRAARRPAG